MKLLLHDGWTATAREGPVPDAVRGRRLPATVPGCITTDLLAAGLVPDPYLDRNEHLLAWIGRTGWVFETSFDADPCGADERVDLVCEGLDTVATVRLNGTVLGATANMHRSYRFDVRSALKGGANRLEVELEAPVEAAERMSQELGELPNNGLHPFNAIRKMACNYGWDWGPDLPTAGIWRPIWLHRWRGARIATVRPLVHLELGGGGLDEGGLDGPASEEVWADESSPRTAPGVVEVHVAVERAGGREALAVEATVAGLTVTGEIGPGATEVVLEAAVPTAELWWPTGYGTQPLYDLEVRLLATGDSAGGGTGSGADGGPTGGASPRPLDSWSSRIGFRSVALDTRPDERGTRLGFVVNGRAISIRGANWIPDDCFVSRIGRDRYRARLEEARDANVNLLRVWGGGIYESEDFYEQADELGLLVWQDFLLACAAYAEEEPLRSEVEAEAREAVGRLSRHPSLAVWSGGNENLWGHEDWGWKPRLGGRSWGSGYYFELFPAILAELDPTRPYMAGSPWSFSPEIHPNDPAHGSMHVWDVWNGEDYPVYRRHRPQFVAEFGFQGPPTWSTLTRAVSERPLRVEGPDVLNHQKATGGMEKLARWLAPHLPEPGSFDEWHWATSLNQARAVSFAVEHWRALTPRCRGTIVWQLNDCWPVMSWAAIDGDGRRKPLWYALRRAYAPRLLTVQPTAGDGPGDGELAVVAVNDGAARWEQRCTVTRRDFDGTVRAESLVTVRAEPGQSSATLLDRAVTTPERPEREVLVVSAGPERALWFYAEDKDLELPPPALATRVERAGDGFDLVLEASSLQRDVALLADRADPGAVCDEMLFTLLPGESRRVHVRGGRDLDPEALVRPEVLRSANQLGRPG